MDLKELIRAPKTHVKYLGPWSKGNIPRHQFPLLGAPRRGYKYGPPYEWRIATFEVKGRECRLLILINEQRQNYRASLAVANGKEFMRICCHEYHTSAEPWHCHTVTDAFHTVPQGVRRKFMSKWPKGGSTKNSAFVSSKEDAANRAFKLFRIDEKGMLL